MARAAASIVCKKHLAPAGWQCASCHERLCQYCAAMKEVYPTSLPACTLCGGAAQVLMGIRSDSTTLADRLPSALGAPLWGDAFSSWLIASIGWAAASYAGPFGTLAGVAWATVGVMMTTRAAGRGKDDDIADESGYFTGLASSLFWLFLFGVPVWIALVGVVLGGAATVEPAPAPGALRLETSASHVFLLAVLVAWAPIALVNAATNAPLKRLFNPFRVMGGFIACGADAVVFFFAWAALSLVGVGLAMVGQTFASWSVPFVGRLASAATMLYVPFVLAQVAGLLLSVRGDVLGWKRPARLMEPLLGNEVPRGTLREDVAPPHEKLRDFTPIELKEEAAAPAKAPGAATRPSVQALDPRSLPRWQGDGADEGPAEVTSTRKVLNVDALPSLASHTSTRIRDCRAVGDVDGALELLEGATGATAELEADLLAWLARAYAERQSFEPAKVLLEAASVAAGPRNEQAKALLLLAELQEQRLEDLAGARATMVRLATDFHDQPVARFAKSWLREHTG